MPYEGEERRRDCNECPSHREHSAKIEHVELDLLTTRSEVKQSFTDLSSGLKADHKDMWEGIKSKVPYPHFISGLTIILTAIGIVTGINWNTMSKVLESNHRVELQMTELKGEFKGVNRRLELLEKQQDDFRKKFIDVSEEVDKHHGGVPNHVE